MRRTLLILLLCLIVSASFAQGVLSKYEYWFDQESPTLGALDGGSAQEHKLSIDTRHLSSGLHSFYYRAQDSDGNWSALASWMFMVRELPKNGTIRATQGEYWIDNLYEQRTAVDIVDDKLSFVYDARNLSEGAHTINYRVKDSEGNYSSLSTWMFFRSELQDPTIVNKAEICEYWFDNDAANLKSVRITENEFSFSADASKLSDGAHSIGYRIRDVLGNYSAPQYWLFVKNTQTRGKRIAWYKTWWNDHYDMADKVDIDADGTEFVYTSQIEVPEYAKTDGFSRNSTARFNIVFGDDAGNTSRIESFDIVYPDNVPPISTIEVIEQTSEQVLLKWYANEDDIEFYNIYVSENNKPFVLWLPNTSATSATFKTKEEVTYRFMVTARDKAGNMEKYDETKCITTKQEEK